MAWLVVMTGEFTLSQLRQCIEIAVALFIAALAVFLTYMGLERCYMYMFMNKMTCKQRCGLKSSEVVLIEDSPPPTKTPHTHTGS